MFVVGGHDDNDNYNKTQIVSMGEEMAEIPDCLSALADHPVEIMGIGGAALPDSGKQKISAHTFKDETVTLTSIYGVLGGLPHVCGGDHPYYPPYNICWRYEPITNKWTVSGKIPREVKTAAYAYHEDWGLIMAGGEGEVGSEDVKEITLTTNGESFTSLYTPQGFLCCVAAIDSNRLFQTGTIYYGQDSETFAYIYYKDAPEGVEEVTPMPTYGSCDCGVARNNNGEVSVVVPGVRTNFGRYDGVAIFSVEKKSWSTGELQGQHLNLVRVSPGYCFLTPPFSRTNVDAAGCPFRR